MKKNHSQENYISFVCIEKKNHRQVLTESKNERN